MEKAFSLMYERLASFFVENLNFERASVVLEAGCGKGQLTVPLVKKVSRIREDLRWVALDISSGPYEGHLEVLKKNLRRQKRLQKFVVTVDGDVRNMKFLENESVDTVLSNELFSELNRKGLEKAIKEFYRVLKHHGQMAHGELSPVPENEAQRLVIDANALSIDTMQPKPPWFSPFSDEVAALLHKGGFRNIRTKYFETNVRWDFGGAIKKLEEWTVDPEYVKKNLDAIRRFGLELPMEHIVFCEK